MIHHTSKWINEISSKKCYCLSPSWQACRKSDFDPQRINRHSHQYFKIELYSATGAPPTSLRERGPQSISSLLISQDLQDFNFLRIICVLKMQNASIKSYLLTLVKHNISEAQSRMHRLIFRRQAPNSDTGCVSDLWKKKKTFDIDSSRSTNDSFSQLPDEQVWIIKIRLYEPELPSSMAASTLHLHPKVKSWVLLLNTFFWGPLSRRPPKRKVRKKGGNKKINAPPQISLAWVAEGPLPFGMHQFRGLRTPHLPTPFLIDDGSSL